MGVRDHFSSLVDLEKESSQLLLMAFLRISRPALACLLLWLALTQEAAIDGGEKGAKAKCKNPKGSQGDVLYEGCNKFTCVKASKKSGIWVESPAIDICCVQNATLFETGTIIQKTMPNNCTLVLLKCEWIDYVPSIVPEVYDIICPAPLENIEEKLDALCDKVEDIQEAVQECNGKEKEQVIMVAGGGSTSVQLYNPKTGFSCFIPPLLYPKVSPVASGLRVCGGSYDNKNCVEFQGGDWVGPPPYLMDYRIGSSGWDSYQGLVLMGGFSQLGTTEILRDYPENSQYDFNLTIPRVYACSIPGYPGYPDSVVLTGGSNDYTYTTLNLVEVYGPDGVIETFPPLVPNLNEAREGHGCGYYYRDGEKVLLVAGGINFYGSDYYDYNPSTQDGYYGYSTYEYESGYKRSTEILYPGNDHWIIFHYGPQALPVPVAYTSHASLYNNIYLLGNFADSSTAVYVWNGETEEWGFGEGSLQEDLGFYAASLVPSETLDYCLEPPAESTTYGPSIKKEDRAEPLKRIRDMMKKRKDNTD